MLRIARIIEELPEEDRHAVAYEVYRTYGGPLFVPLEDREESPEERRRRLTAERVQRYRERYISVTESVTSALHGNAPSVTDSVTSALPGGTIGGAKQPRKHNQESSAGFQAFWLKYPKRVGKGAAQDAWRKHACESKAPEILQALENQRAFLLREGGKFIPNPATWLNQHRWEDEPPEPSPLTPKTAGNIAAAQAFVERMQRGQS